MRESKTIAALHKQLDQIATCHMTLSDVRKVLADALEELGDPLAEGYRALGYNDRRPYFSGAHQNKWCWLTAPENDGSPSRLPRAWWNRLKGGAAAPRTLSDTTWKCFESRREADDAAARAFLRLPERSRRKLLKEVYG